MTEIQHQTATVHVIKIGPHELTLSKYRQLDTYDMEDGLQHFAPFGRVNTGATHQDPAGRKRDVTLEVRGRNTTTGTLTKLHITQADEYQMQTHSIHKQLLSTYQELPLILLGGMR